MSTSGVYYTPTQIAQMQAAIDQANAAAGNNLCTDTLRCLSAVCWMVAKCQPAPQERSSNAVGSTYGIVYLNKPKGPRSLAAGSVTLLIEINTI